MSDTTHEWQRWQAHRKKRTGEPDDASIQKAMDAWKQALDEGSLSDEDIDQELVRLLERIHRAPESPPGE